LDVSDFLTAKLIFIVLKGMNYVVAAFLLVINDTQDVADLDLRGLSVQEVVFWLTISLIRRKGMAELWKHKMPGFVSAICRARAGSSYRD
jgi:hypothetical protein